MDEQQTLEALDAIGLRGDVRVTGSPEWRRIFLIDSGGITQGRFSLQNGVLVHTKFYVEKVAHGPVVHADERYVYAWTLWTRARERLDVARWNKAVQEALKLAHAERDAKQAARDALPPLGLNARGIQKTRKPLQLNVRKHLNALLLNPSVP